MHVFTYMQVSVREIGGSRIGRKELTKGEKKYENVKFVQVKQSPLTPSAAATIPTKGQAITD